MYVYIYTYMCVCVYIYIHTHTRAHTHKHVYFNGQFLTSSKESKFIAKYTRMFSISIEMDLFIIPWLEVLHTFSIWAENSIQ